jgi:glycosyl transferase family 87
VEADARALTLAGRVAIALSLAWVIVLAIAFALRLSFPLELEWMEGGILHQAWRFQHGMPIYPPPSAEFVPFLYTPGYAILLAILGWVFPLDYALGRVVSIAAWAAIGGALWRAVGREGKPTSHRALAVGLWCSGYVFAFRWVDLARPDTLFLALALWALVLLRESWGDAKKAALAGVLMALAFWTKQTAAILILASGVGALLVAPRQLWIYAGVIAVIDGGIMLLGNAKTDGWLWRYVFELHQAHAFNDERFWKKTWGMFVHAAPFLTVLALWLLARFVRPWLSRERRIDRDRERRLAARLSAHRGLIYWGLVAVASALVSALGYSTQWAEPNAFMPGVCFGALWLAVALPQGGRAEIVAIALCCAQLCFSLFVEPMYQPIQNRGIAALRESYAWQDPARTIPGADRRARAQELRDELEGSRHEVLALHRPWWSIIAGSSGHVGSMGITDVAEGDRKAIEQTILARIKNVELDEIRLEGEPPAWMRPALRGRYKVLERRQGDARVRPMSGWMSDAGMVTPYVADQILMVPIGSDPVREGVIVDFEDGTLQGVEAHGGFGRRPVSGFTGDLPQPAGYGGEFWLSSAGPQGRVEEKGTAIVGPIELAAGQTIACSIGALGKLERSSVTIRGIDDEVLATLPLPTDRAILHEATWTADQPHTIRLHIQDDDGAGALVVDDVRLR